MQKNSIPASSSKAIGVEHIKLKQSAEHLQKIDKELQLQKKKINR